MSNLKCRLLYSFFTKQHNPDLYFKSVTLYRYMVKVNKGKHTFIKFKNILKFFEIFNIYKFILAKLNQKLSVLRKNYIQV